MRDWEVGIIVTIGLLDSGQPNMKERRQAVEQLEGLLLSSVAKLQTELQEGMGN